MKKRILVIYYTQTGQLKDILDSITADIKEEAYVDYIRYEPQKAFPFPWTAAQFFDAMPESVEQIPIALKPLPKEVFEKEYDLVILGYQPWFLHPSQPTTSFLKSDDAKKLLKGKPVITVVGSRNMWLNAQERVKAGLKEIGAELAGNIVLKDSYTNLVSLLTVIRWSFKGQKEASGLLPAAGVQEKDIQAARRFGKPILYHLQHEILPLLHTELMKEGAIDLDSGLVLLEQRGIKNFRYWAKFIREKGGPGDPNRLGRVMLFKNLLLMGIFVLSPISSVSASIKKQLQKKNLERDVAYFKSLAYEEGRI
jgi:flavodoxin